MRVLPVSPDPDRAGWAVENGLGPAASTGPSRLAYAVVVPVESVARTARLSVCPTSLGPRVRDLPVTPFRSLQALPIVSQRYQA